MKSKAKQNEVAFIRNFPIVEAELKNKSKQNYEKNDQQLVERKHCFYLVNPSFARYLIRVEEGQQNLYWIATRQKS